MRIVYLAAGAGDTYCGACARDQVLVRGLLRAGHEVHMIPLYTPLKLEDETLPVEPIFFGGINMFLQQTFSGFRYLPRVMDRFLDRPGFLRWASKFAIEVEPRRLGAMTVSVLAGRHGRQRKEVDRLLDYLSKGDKPDVVNLTNSLISSLAPEIKKRLGVPVVCTFQGEDEFVKELAEPYSTKARDLIRENAKLVDLFICPNEKMVGGVAEFLGVGRERLRVVRTAVEVEAGTHGVVSPFTVGYLSSIRRSKGLDILVEAVGILAKAGREIRLLAAGRVADRAYWEQVQGLVKSRGLAKRFEYLGEVDGMGKVGFFRRCSLLVGPSRYEEPRGVAAMEAMAAGVGVVVPRWGVFPEVLGMGGGGVMVEGYEPERWAEAIGGVMGEEVLLGEAARACVAAHCSPAVMVAETVGLYEEVVGG